MPSFVITWTGGLASVLPAILGAMWALVFLAIAGLFPPQRPARSTARAMARRQALRAVVKARWAA